jgi:Ran GTPase-activating protein (RanGAP) involved in mRNA processing and transport
MRAVAGAAFGALVATNAPALRILNVACCGLHAAALGPLVDALPHNTHLRTLECHNNGITEAFARERLLPALQANASLRELTLIDTFVDSGTHPAILRELQDMVAARAAAAPQ